MEQRKHELRGCDVARCVKYVHRTDDLHPRQIAFLCRGRKVRGIRGGSTRERGLRQKGTEIEKRERKSRFLIHSSIRDQSLSPGRTDSSMRQMALGWCFGLRKKTISLIKKEYIVITHIRGFLRLTENHDNLERGSVRPGARSKALPVNVPAPKTPQFNESGKSKKRVLSSKEKKRHLRLGFSKRRQRRSILPPEHNTKRKRGPGGEAGKQK